MAPKVTDDKKKQRRALTAELRCRQLQHDDKCVVPLAAVRRIIKRATQDGGRAAPLISGKGGFSATHGLTSVSVLRAARAH